MRNVTMAVKGSKLTITVDLDADHGKSKSGKTTIIASSDGNQPIPGTDAKLGLNIYR